MAISSSVNWFCASIIFLFILILVIKTFQNLLSDKTYLDAFFQSNIQKYEDPVDDFLISVVYICESPINVIVKDLKAIENIYEQNFPLNKKLELIIFADAAHKDYGDIRLLDRCFPNLILYTTSISQKSASNFFLASWISKGQYIVDSRSLLYEIDNLQKKPKEYISIYKSDSLSHFSAISKQCIQYLSRVHFVHSIPIEEFEMISPIFKLTINYIDHREHQERKLMLTHIYYLFLEVVAGFCYKNGIWKAQLETKKHKMTNASSKDEEY